MIKKKSFQAYVDVQKFPTITDTVIFQAHFTINDQQHGSRFEVTKPTKDNLEELKKQVLDKLTLFLEANVDMI